MTTAFVDAATLMARSLGADDHAFVVIDHPISSASPEALVERARVAARTCRDLLLGEVPIQP